jgi:hypothetical protein
MGRRAFTIHLRSLGPTQIAALLIVIQGFRAGVFGFPGVLELRLLEGSRLLLGFFRQSGQVVSPLWQVEETRVEREARAHIGLSGEPNYPLVLGNHSARDQAARSHYILVSTLVQSGRV